MPGKGTIDAIFALRMLMEKYRKGQKEIHCVFVDLEKAYDRSSKEGQGCTVPEISVKSVSVYCDYG